MEMKSILAVPFNTNNYNNFVLEFFNEIDRVAYKEIKPNATFANIIDFYSVHGTYKDPEGNEIIVLSVKVKNNSNAKQAQRDFVSYLLSNDFNQYSAAMVAYYDDVRTNWKLSFVTVEMEMGDNGIELKFKPAKRFSFLVGKDEPTKTYTQQLKPIYDSRNNPTLNQITNAFSVSKLSDDFYNDYKNKYIELRDILVKSKEFKSYALSIGEKVNSYAITFAKKTLSQVVFLFFIQKKGWLGVPFGKKWGEGNKKYILDSIKDYQNVNYFDEFLEPLFYNALNNKRPDDFYLGNKVPFLNGGLFHPIDNYNWEKTSFNIENSFWFNKAETGFIDILGQYNFTVDECDPNEQDIAIDPEMLGRIFESLLDIDTRKNKGAFYTPRKIVKYMCVQALANKISSEIGLDFQSIENYVLYGDALKEKEFIETFADDIDDYVSKLTIVDPAVGSGAFLVGMMNEIVKLRINLQQYKNDKTTILNKYDLKVNCIQNNLYGVDLEYDAIEIAKLRLWLSLIVDEDTTEYAPKPLPNLNFHLRVGNSLLQKYEGIVLWDENWKTRKSKKQLYLTESLFDSNFIDDLIESIKIDKKYFYTISDDAEKNRMLRVIENKQLDLITERLREENKLDLLKDFQKLIKQKTKPFFVWKMEFMEIFENGGFDIVIGNPPYISTKGVDEKTKNALKEEYGFADDTYSHFYFLGMNILKEKGNISYITSKSFWTTQTKKNLRELLLDNKIHYIFDTANPFEAAMVDTCIVFLTKDKLKKEKNIIRFYNGRESLDNPQLYMVNQSVYEGANNKVIFTPSEKNIKIYGLYNESTKLLYEHWWDKISTSKNINQNKAELDLYRENLKPGDIALLGCLTEGGQGLATGNNGKYIGVRKKSKWADKIFESRPKKLMEAIKKYDIELPVESKNYSNTIEYYKSLNEKEIVKLFDELKEQYGRDIFGQGYLFRVVEEDEIANPDLLSEDEKINGIEDGKPQYVLYDKGDKDGNRWYLETPFAICWSKENVRFLKTNSGKKGTGMPVVRNPQFYFKEGFCWTDINSTYLKSRLKDKGIFDVVSMTLFTQTNIPDWYYVSLINTKFISEYVDVFLNNTSHFQINDARRLPIVIPSNDQLHYLEVLFNELYSMKKKSFSNYEIDNEIVTSLEEKIEKYVVENIYKVL